MQIIAELEPTRRGLYAGAVGYLDFAGNLDFCIAIRTIIDARRHARTCRPAPASSPTRTRRPSTRRRATRRGRCCGRSSWRRRDCSSAMVLVIDNYDSFTYNLVQYLGELGARRRSCAATTRSRSTRSPRCAPDRIVISPGPGPARRTPASSVDVIRRFGPRDAAARRLPRAPGDRRRVRRRGRARRRSRCTARRRSIEHDGRGVFARPRAAVRRRRATTRSSSPSRPAGRARGHGAHARTARSWALRHRALPGARRAVPPRVDPDRPRAGSSCATSWSCERCSPR